MAKKIQQGRQRRFTEFSSARGAIPNSAEHNGGRVIFISDNGRRHYYSDVKKRNSKKYWKLGIWWNFKVWNFKNCQKFGNFFFQFSILFRKYDRLVSRVVLWFVEASILESLAKEKNGKNAKNQNIEIYVRFFNIGHRIHNFKDFAMISSPNSLELKPLQIIKLHG